MPPKSPQTIDRRSALYQYRVRCSNGAAPWVTEPGFDPNPRTLLAALATRDQANAHCCYGQHSHRVERRRITPGKWERCEHAPRP